MAVPTSINQQEPPPSGGVPGTDSNGDVTDTMITDNGDSSSETILNKYDYLPNKTVQNIEHEIGAG